MRRLLRTLLPLAAIAILALCRVARIGGDGISPARGFAPRQLLVKFEGEQRGRAIELPPGAGVRQAARALRRNPNVVYAEPNYIATASAAPTALLTTPTTPAASERPREAAAAPGELGLQAVELPLLRPGERRWDADLARRDRRRRSLAQPDRSRPSGGGRGRRRRPRQRHRLPLARHRLPPQPRLRPAPVRPRLRLRRPATACRSTKAATAPTSPARSPRRPATGSALTGLAYRAKLMPVRVLDRNGVRQRVRHRPGDPLRRRPPRAGDQHELQLRLRQAGAGGRRSAAGSLRAGRRHGRLGRQPRLRELRLRAGDRAAGDRRRRHHRGRLPRRLLACRPGDRPRRPRRRNPAEPLPLGRGAPDLPGDAACRTAPRNSRIPANYVGTSMAAAHVSGVAAMVLASRRIDPPARPQGTRPRGDEAPAEHRPRPRPAAATAGRRADRRRRGDGNRAELLPAR